MRNILIWYRNDLRTHDHEPLYRAISAKHAVAAVYCIDKQCFGETSYGLKRVGARRVQFLIQSLVDLRHNLNKLGIKLYIRLGRHDESIASLCEELDIDEVYYHREVTDEEVIIEKALENTLMHKQIPLTGFWGSTLYHIEDLPFPVKHLPDLFTDFRKAVEKESQVRGCYNTPKDARCINTTADEGKIPNLAELGYDTPKFDNRSVMKFDGGETHGLNRLLDFIYGTQSIAHYKETRNQMLGTNNSSKLSAWLALGCLSPRKVFEEVKKFEASVLSNQSTYWLVFELLWRDYFRYIALKYGNQLFKKGGIKGYPIPWKEDLNLFEKWKMGQTGFPIIDANMQELLHSGFMSNRGRQNVASFLTKNLGINWQWGAAWFEHHLIDHDVCSNYGNWNYSAGIGNDARGFRYFNIIKQSSDYDPNGHYTKHWIDALNAASPMQIHDPIRYDLTVHGYCRPIVDLENSAQQQKIIYERSLHKTKLGFQS
jgi:deoxyribodipyrimidine photo-lyase